MVKETIPGPRPRAATLRGSAVVLCWGDKKALVALPESYEEAENVVRKVFNLQNVKIALEADDLDICEGESVQIQPSAWVLVSHLLGRVTVKAVKESNPLQPEENLFEEDEEIRVGPTDSVTDDVEDEFFSNESNMEAEDQVEDAITYQREAEEDHYSDGSYDAPLVDVHGEDGPDHEEGAGVDEVQEGNDHIPGAPCHTQDDSRVVVKQEVEEHVIQDLGTVNLHEVAPMKQEAIAQSYDDQAELDEKYLIGISQASTEEPTPFSVRSSYTVKKLLKGVCKNFGLQYQGAQLRLLVSTEDPDGETFEAQFPCEPDETLARAGINRDSQLVVVGAKEERSA